MSKKIIIEQRAEKSEQPKEEKLRQVTSEQEDIIKIYKNSEKNLENIEKIFNIVNERKTSFRSSGIVTLDSIMTDSNAQIGAVTTDAQMAYLNAETSGIADLTTKVYGLIGFINSLSEAHTLNESSAKLVENIDDILDAMSKINVNNITSDNDIKTKIESWISKFYKELAIIKKDFEYNPISLFDTDNPLTNGNYYGYSIALTYNENPHLLGYINIILNNMIPSLQLMQSGSAPISDSQYHIGSVNYGMDYMSTVDMGGIATADQMAGIARTGQWGVAAGQTSDMAGIATTGQWGVAAGQTSNMADIATAGQWDAAATHAAELAAGVDWANMPSEAINDAFAAYQDSLASGTSHAAALIQTNPDASVVMNWSDTSTANMDANMAEMTAGMTNEIMQDMATSKPPSNLLTQEESYTAMIASMSKEEQISQILENTRKFSEMSQKVLNIVNPTTTTPE